MARRRGLLCKSGFCRRRILFRKKSPSPGHPPVPNVFSPSATRPCGPLWKGRMFLPARVGWVFFLTELRRSDVVFGPWGSIPLVVRKVGRLLLTDSILGHLSMPASLSSSWPQVVWDSPHRTPLSRSAVSAPALLCKSPGGGPSIDSPSVFCRSMRKCGTF